MKESTRCYINNEVAVEIDSFSSKFVEEAIKEKERVDAFLEANNDGDEELIKDGMERDLVLMIVQTDKEGMQNLL